MPDLPTGTVTFLFTDIEGSTQLLQDLGGAQYGEALEVHRKLLREVITKYGGYEVDTQGDAFFIAFSRALDAVTAAREAQHTLVSHTWPGGRELRVRMGIHTSEAKATSEGYVGVGVHRGARICGAGHGGQVLLSHTTYALIEEEELPFQVLDLGEHRLKDLSEPHRIFQLVDPSLSRDFPPLRTLENRPTNLPIQATPLVGRTREIADITELLRHDHIRLVTLTGPGGSGKTRLALQAAANLVEEFPNGVFLVTLAALKESALVISSVAQVLGINEAAGQSLAAYVAHKKLLLVMDNFEQVIAAAPDLAELLASASGIKMLATSREPLHVASEHVFPVPPLQLPDPRHVPSLSTLSQYEAVALFIERAQAVHPRFEVTTSNAPAVAEICVRLDGLPLALELAAARIPLLSPEAMLGRLGERLKLLRGGARDLPVRQQTLRDTIAWSYDLLTVEERTVFAQLGVFSGGFTLEAVEGVCEADLDTVASLLAKSLIRRDDERFTMLETIREYALEQLASHGNEVGIRERHAAFFERLAEQAFSDRFEQEGRWSEELEREHDNLRGALKWLSRIDSRRALRLAGALGWFWHVHSYLTEGRAHITEALAANAGEGEDRARALSALGEIVAWQGEVVATRPLVDEAISIWRTLGREQEVALALHDLGWGYFVIGDDATAKACMERSLELLRSTGNRFLMNRTQIGLLQVLVSLGDIDTVEQLVPEALQLAQQLGDLRSEHFAFHFLADCPLIRGDCVAAEDGYRRALKLAVELGDRTETAIEMQGLAMAAAGRSRPKRALRLEGAAAAQFDELGIDISGIRFWNDLLDRYVGTARAGLGAETAGALMQEGRQMGFEQAITEALTPSIEE